MHLSAWPASMSDAWLAHVGTVSETKTKEDTEGKKMTAMKRIDSVELVSRIETYINDYVTLADPQYSLPIALWTIGTFCFPDFDAFPYMVITSATKRSGKSRLSEMISFACSNPRNFAAMTAFTLFYSIETEQPTLVIDEAEKLSSEAGSDMRAILNVGYRRGQTVPRRAPGGMKEFNTYCPKIFILIGDVYDTLRDRSIVITMQRAETRKRFTFEAAREEGRQLRELISDAVKNNGGNIKHAFQNHKGLPFLMDRDEEIWTALFCICEVFCPGRFNELQMAASDMAAEKTGEARKFINLKEAETAATNDEYAKKALGDLFGLFVTGGKAIRTEDAINGLKAIPTAPWRKFRGGEGITPHILSELLDRFGVQPVRIAIGSGRGNQQFYRGYKREQVEKALKKL